MNEKKRNKSAKFILKIVIAASFGVFLVLLAIWGIDLGVRAYRLFRFAKSIQSLSYQTKPDELISKVHQGAADMSAIHKEIDPLLPILDAFQGLPGIGAYLSQIDPLVHYANGLAQAGNEVIVGLQPMLEDQNSMANMSVLEHLTQVLQSGQLHFTSASQYLTQAVEVRGKIRVDLMPSSFRSMYEKIDNKFPFIVAGVQALEAGPQLLGAATPQRYLVLAQNRDELRGTGGFISGIGQIVFVGGKITQFELGDSYSVDDFSKPYPKPPEALKRFMLADYWVTRDSNWSPDFPSASLEAQLLYELSTNDKTQGVIAFNQLAVKRLMEVIGPVVVPGTAEPVTAENVEVFMQQAWAPEPGTGITEEWWQHRKDFMPLLGLAIIDKLLSNNKPQQLVEMGSVFIDLLTEGQVLLYFTDPRAEAALTTAGLDGALHAGDEDYLYLVDSNVGFNKVDSVIQRSISYSVDLSDLNHPFGKAALSYTHSGSGNQECKQEITYGSGTYQDLQQRCYLDYWRLYLPDGSKLISSTAQPVPAGMLLNGVGWSGQVDSYRGEAGLQVFAGLLMLAPDQSSQIVISYQLPAGVVKMVDTSTRNYSVRLGVQPGLEGLPVRLNIRIPNQAIVLDPGDGWQQIATDTWAWQGTLTSPKELNLSLVLGNP